MTLCNNIYNVSCGHIICISSNTEIVQWTLFLLPFLTFNPHYKSFIIRLDERFNLYLVSVHIMEAAAQSLCSLHNTLWERWSSRLEVLFLKQSLFPLRFLCWMQLCVTVTVNTHCSPSPSSQLHGDAEGRSERESDIYTVRVWVCVSLWMLLPLHQRKLERKCACVHAICVFVCERMHTGLYVRVCVFACSSSYAWGTMSVRVCVWASQPSAVFSSSLTVIPLSAICPSLKRQLFSKGPLG